MENNSLVSFIIPIYKTPQELLRNCLDSVFKYSGPMELVCVLDSPGDACEAVLDEYAAMEPRMRLLKNDRNRGVSYSRNHGLDAAIGEYVAFVDADDEIIAATYETALRFAIENDLDGCAITAGKSEIARFGVPYGEAVVGTIRDSSVAVALAGSYYMAVYPMVLRRALLGEKGIRFLEGHRYGEDFMAMVQLLCTGGRFACMNKIGYKCVGHPNSACRRPPNVERYTHGLITVLTVLRTVASSDVAAVARHWYLGRCVEMVLFDRTAARFVKGDARQEYYANLKALSALICDEYAEMLRNLPELLLRFLQGCPSLWFLPGMPLSQVLRVLGHFGLLFKNTHKGETR